MIRTLRLDSNLNSNSTNLILVAALHYTGYRVAYFVQRRLPRHIVVYRECERVDAVEYHAYQAQVHQARY